MRRGVAKNCGVALHFFYKITIMGKNNKFKMVLLNAKYYSFLKDSPFNYQIMMKESRPFWIYSKDNIFRLKLFYIIPFTSSKRTHKFDIQIPNCKIRKKIRISKLIPILNNDNFIEYIDSSNEEYEDTYKKFKEFISQDQKLEEIEKEFNNFLALNIDSFYESFKKKEFHPTNILRLNNQLYIYDKNKSNLRLEKMLLSKFWFYINNFNNQTKIQNKDFELEVNKDEIIFKNNLDTQNLVTINLENKNWKFNILWQDEFCQYLIKNSKINEKFLEKYSYPFSKNNTNRLDIFELQTLLKKIENSNRDDYNFKPKIKNKIIQISLNYLNTEKNFKLLEKWVSKNFFKVNKNQFNLLKLIWEIENIKISSINSFKNNFLCLSDELIKILLCKIKLKRDELIKEYDKNNSNIFKKLNPNTLKKYLKKYDPAWTLPDFVKEIIRLLEFERLIGKNEIENFSKFNEFINFLKNKVVFYKNEFKKNLNIFHSEHHEKILELESELSNKTINFKDFKKTTAEYKFLIQIKQLSQLNKQTLKFESINLNDGTAKILLNIVEEIKKGLQCQLTELHIDLNSYNEINDFFIYLSKIKNKIFLDENLIKLEQLLIQERRISVNERLTRNLSNGQDYKEFLISESKKYIQRYNINIHSENIKNEAEKILKIIQKN